MKRTKKAQLTPKKAVLRFCKQCAVTAAEIENCSGKDCPFHKYRLGKGRPPLGAIRKQCLLCMCGSRQLVKECTTTDCPLYSYREGINPNRGGVGGKFSRKT